jgi:glutamyl-tRNA reductase
MANWESILYIVGINHKTSSVNQRESFQLSRKDIAESLEIIHGYDGVDGVAILSTCNRMEIYLVIQPQIDAYEIVKRFYFENKYIDIEEYKHYFYQLNGINATRHLFRVISGLESLVLGEYQIQGQLKEAYSKACEVKSVDKILHKLFHAAFRAGKNVRSKTCFGACKQSLSGVAAQVIIDNLNVSETIAIIGVNENTKIMAEALSKAGFYNFIFANRTFYKAEIMANDFGGRAENLSNLYKILFESQAVFSCTGAPGYIISSDLLKHLAVQERCPEVIIDMAVPRDIDTDGLPQEIKVYNINNLKDYLDKERENLLVDIPEAERIIEDEVSLFQAWSETQGNDLINPYAEKFELIRQQLLEENREQFSDQSFDQVNRMSKHLVHRMQSIFMRILLNNQQQPVE